MPRTPNASIRFDQEKKDFFVRLNPTHNKPQQIVDELLNMFWYAVKGRDMITDKNYGNLILNNEVVPVKAPEDKLHKLFDEIPIVKGEYIDAAGKIFANAEIVNPATEKYNAFMEEVKAAPSAKHVEAIAFIIKSDKVLSSLQKQTLERFAIEHSKTFDF